MTPEYVYYGIETDQLYITDKPYIIFCLFPEFSEDSYGVMWLGEL